MDDVEPAAMEQATEVGAMASTDEARVAAPELPPQEPALPGSHASIPAPRPTNAQVKLHLPLAALAVGLLGVLVVRLGLLSVLLLLSGAFVLSAVPEFRFIVDGTVAAAASPEQRLSTAFPSLAVRSPPTSPLPPEPEPSDPLVPASGDDALAILPAPVAKALDHLISFVVRDFVENWYTLPSVSTGDPQFLVLTRSLLCRFVANAHERIKSKNGREVAVYLLGCVSMTVVRELDESVPVSGQEGKTTARGRDQSPAAVEARATRRRRQTKTVAEELVLTCLPPGVANLGLTRSLLTEILAVQLENTVRGIGDDWINQAIIAALAPPAPSTGDKELRVTATNGSAEGALPQALREVAEEVGDAIDEAVGLSTSIQPQEPGFRIPASPRSLLAEYLEAQSPSMTASIVSSLSSLPPWKPSAHSRDSLLPSLLGHAPIDEDLASSLAGFVDSSPKSEALVRLWTQLGSFAAVMKGTTAGADVRREDAKSVLRRVRDTVGSLVDGGPAGPDELKEEELTRVLSTTIQSIEKGTPGATTFDTLQAWLIEELERGGVGKWIRKQQQGVADRATSPKAKSARRQAQPPQSPARGAAPPSTWTDWVARMEIPRVQPSEGADGELATPPPDQPSLAEYDFGSMIRPDSQHEGAPQPARDRGSSFTRKARSPPASELGSPTPPRSSGNSGVASPQKGKARVEESDMGQGLSIWEDEQSPRQSMDSVSIPPEAPVHTPAKAPEPLPRPRAESSASRSTTSSVGGISEIPPFSVSVTDISIPSAWDAKGQVRHKRDLEFVIAVEAQGVPGFIVTRKWTEVEKMDAEVHRSLQTGTLDFPRALLPSLPYKTTDTLCKGLETYLESLLREPRYASSQPVLRFFARERAGSAEDLSIWTIGRGVTNLGSAVGEGVNKGVAVPANLVSQGFNQISKGFGTFGLKKRASVQQLPQEAVVTPNGSSSRAPTSNISDSRPSFSGSDHDSAVPSSPAPISKDLSPKGATVGLPPVPVASSSTGSAATPTSSRSDAPAEPTTPLAATANRMESNPTARGYEVDAVEESPALPPKPRYAVHKPRRSVDMSARGGPSPTSAFSPKSTSSSSSSLSRSAASTPSPVTSRVTPAPVVSDTPALLAFEPPGLSAITRPAGKLFGAIGSLAESIAVVDAGAPGAEDTIRSADSSRFPSRRSSVNPAPLPAGRPSSTLADPPLREARKSTDVSATAKQPSRDSLDVKVAALSSKSVPTAAPKASAQEAPAKSAVAAAPTAQPKRPTVLTQHDFDNIVVSAMSVLEAAYGLTGQWSMKRGVFRVLETVLRTSYASAIKASVTTVIDSASDPDVIAHRLDNFRRSFWPDDKWWAFHKGSGSRDRSDEDKAKTREEARRLFVGSWDSLKLALGAGATAQAAGQLFDTLQGEGATILVHGIIHDLVRLLILL